MMAHPGAARPAAERAAGHPIGCRCGSALLAGRVPNGRADGRRLRLRPGRDLAATGAELEEEAPPFDVEAGAARLQQAACVRGLLPAGPQGQGARATYPECGRLAAAAEQTQVIGEFIDGLHGQGVQLMIYREDPEGLPADGPRADLCGVHAASLRSWRETFCPAVCTSPVTPVTAHRKSAKSRPFCLVKGLPPPPWPRESPASVGQKRWPADGKTGQPTQCARAPTSSGRSTLLIRGGHALGGVVIDDRTPQGTVALTQRRLALWPATERLPARPAAAARYKQAMSEATHSHAMCHAWSAAGRGL